MSDVLEVFSGDVQTAKMPGLGLVDFVRWQTVIDKWPQSQPAIPPDVREAILTLCEVNEYHWAARLLHKWLDQQEPTL